MNLHLQHPEALLIQMSSEEKNAFGGNQSWFNRYWQKEAGCGPTCAATILTYMARTKPQFEALYQHNNFTKKTFVKHMNQVYRHVTPGILGVHKTHLFINGVVDYAANLGLHLMVHSIITHPATIGARSTDVLIQFIEDAFANDAPIAFLNLDIGEAKRLQPWHWITITDVYMESNQIMAIASDEGNKRTFNLGLWYLTTKKHGGLIYFT